MSKTTKTTTAAQPVSAVAASHMDSAFTAYSNAKGAATEAVAHTYLVYLNTLRPGGKEWLDAQVKVRDAEIKAHNDNIPTRKEDAAAYNAKAASKQKATATEQVKKDASLTEEEWLAEVRTKIEPQRQGASPFTTVCRLVLKFDHPYHASNTSRYCAVLEWLYAKFHKQNGRLEKPVALEGAA
jgi:hypothetical protein